MTRKSLAEQLGTLRVAAALREKMDMKTNDIRRRRGAGFLESGSCVSCRGQIFRLRFAPLKMTTRDAVRFWV